MNEVWYTVLVQVHGEEPVDSGQPYADWMNDLRQVVGAGAISFREHSPWTVGEHKRWERDWIGQYRRIDEPYANVWQQITGVASRSMALVWAAIHLAAPLEEAGYTIASLWAGRSDEMVVIA